MTCQLISSPILIICRQCSDIYVDPLDHQTKASLRPEYHRSMGYGTMLISKIQPWKIRTYRIAGKFGGRKFGELTLFEHLVK